MRLRVRSASVVSCVGATVAVVAMMSPRGTVRRSGRLRNVLHGQRLRQIGAGQSRVENRIELVRRGRANGRTRMPYASRRQQPAAPQQFLANGHAGLLLEHDEGGEPAVN